MVESSIGIVGACLPLLRPIITDTRARSILSSLRTMLSRSSSLSHSTSPEAVEFAKTEPRNLRICNFEDANMV